MSIKSGQRDLRGNITLHKYIVFGLRWYTDTSEAVAQMNEKINEDEDFASSRLHLSCSIVYYYSHLSIIIIWTQAIYARRLANLWEIVAIARNRLWKYVALVTVNELEWIFRVARRKINFGFYRLRVVNCDR